jgi:hypothetical protein
LVALACNLSSAPPATLVPRPTITPQPTLGYATLSPGDLPQQMTGVPSTDFELFNLINQVESDRLLVHVDTLQGFHTRHVNSGYTRTDWGIGAAYTYIRKQFEMYAQQTGNLVVFDSEFSLTWNDVNSRAKNVAAVINGSEVGAGVILIGAHYDSIANDAPKDNSIYAPGADDNASGIAAILELARILSSRPHRSTIMLVAFSAEEVGRRGSIAFVNDYIRARNIPLTAMINVDTIGSYTGPNGGTNDSQIRLFSSDPNESSSRQLARSINFIGFNHALGMEIIVQPRIDREGRYGDHESFSEAGYPAVRFIEALESIQLYNGAPDTMDDIQVTYLTEATQTILTVVTALADGPRPPKTVHLRDNGNGTRRLIWEPVPDAAGYIVALRRPNSVIYDQQFPINDTFVDWEKFIPAEFAGVAVAAKDANGLLGPLSQEYLITQ